MTKLRHRIRRFFWSLRAKPLSPRDQSEAKALLRPEERHLFWGQPPIDQRHAIEGARRALAARPGNRPLARAALLHDVGKRHAQLGVLGRSLASGLELFGITPKRWHSYYQHGEIGARELEEAGAEDLVVRWAETHTREEPPADFDRADWEVLRHADMG